MSTRERKKAELRAESRKLTGPSAKLRWLRMSPRKVRLVVDLIRGRSVEEALNLLTFSRKSAALPVAKLVRSALANGQDRGLVRNVDALYVDEAFVDEGPTWRRWLPRAMGRATRIRKRTCHVTIVLDEVKASA